MQEDTKDLYWFGSLGSVIPYVQFEMLVYHVLACSRGLQTGERGTSVASLWFVFVRVCGVSGATRESNG